MRALAQHARAAESRHESIAGRRVPPAEGPSAARRGAYPRELVAPPLPSSNRGHTAREAARSHACGAGALGDHGQPFTEARADDTGEPSATARDLLSGEARRRVNRRLRFELRERLRTLQASTRARDCGHRPIGGAVNIVRTEDGRCKYSGLLCCDSVWGCFVCAGRILAAYASDLNVVVEHHGFARTLLGSFTTRHYRDDDLQWLRREQSRCFTELLAGKGWRLVRERFGIVGVVRAIDVTFGVASGFHAHLHPLLFLARSHEGKVGRRELAAINAELFKRWCSIVRRRMGEKYVPNEDHGVLLKPCYRADYLVKMGVSLEVTGSFSKTAKNGNCSMLEIAVRAADGDERFREVFRTYARGMKGAKFLTWSKGAKKVLKEARRDADEPVHDETLVASIPNKVWRLIRGIPASKVELLEAGEDRGNEGVAQRIELWIGVEHAVRAGPALRHLAKADRVLALDFGTVRASS